MIICENKFEFTCAILYYYVSLQYYYRKDFAVLLCKQQFFKSSLTYWVWFAG